MNREEFIEELARRLSGKGFYAAASTLLRFPEIQQALQLRQNTTGGWCVVLGHHTPSLKTAEGLALISDFILKRRRRILEERFGSIAKVVTRAVHQQLAPYSGNRWLRYCRPLLRPVVKWTTTAG